MRHSSTYVILMSKSSGSISVPAAVSISERPCMRVFWPLGMILPISVEKVFSFWQTNQFLSCVCPFLPQWVLLNIVLDMNIMLDIMLPRSKHGACWTG